MIITCPYCGPRDSSEFVYQGEDGRTRPDPASTDQAAWNAYVYDRVNTAGEHEEIWQHSGGCRAHLRLVRNTLTHKISSVSMARHATVPRRRRKAETPA
ncbi:MAG: sarcosine oxidase subunit delta [Hyphomicrobiales bacterium]|nr:sarcosine oxidase subunit delta [Hyphomicrobiales bacterium]